ERVRGRAGGTVEPGTGGRARPSTETGRSARSMRPICDTRPRRRFGRFRWRSRSWLSGWSDSGSTGPRRPGSASRQRPRYPWRVPPTTIGELRAARYPDRTVKEELRANLLAKLGRAEALFPSVVGFDDSVLPAL